MEHASARPFRSVIRRLVLLHPILAHPTYSPSFIGHIDMIKSSPFPQKFILCAALEHPCTYWDTNDRCSYEGACEVLVLTDCIEVAENDIEVQL
jgi:hypothetical protein